MEKERAIHETFLSGNTEKDRDKAALYNEFLYAIRYEHDKKQYSYYAKTLTGALTCKSTLASMGATASIVKL